MSATERAARCIQRAWQRQLCFRTADVERVSAATKKYTIEAIRDMYASIEYAHGEDVIWKSHAWTVGGESIRYDGDRMQIYSIYGCLDQLDAEEWLCTVTRSQLKEILGARRLGRIAKAVCDYKGLYERHGLGCSREVNEIRKCFVEGNNCLDTPHELQTFVAWLAEHGSSDDATK